MSVFNEQVIIFHNNEDSNEFHLGAIGKLFPDKNYVIARDHSASEIIEYIIDGKGYVESEGITREITAGDCYILRKGSSHKYYSDIDEPYTKIWLNLSGSLVNSWFSLYKINTTPYIKKFDMQPYFDTLKDYIQNYNEKTNMDIMLLIHELLFKLSKAPNSLEVESQTFSGFSKTSAKLILEVKKYIEKSAIDVITIDHLTEKFNISKSQLIKLYKKQYGTTPYAYAIACKVEIARTLLITSDLSIEAIAEKLHFYDRNHFNKLFLKHYNTTPSNYRKSVLNT